MIFYKESDFQAIPIGKIPSDWGRGELGDENIARIIAGQAPPSHTYHKENQGLPFLQGKTEFGGTFPSPTVYCSKPIKIAKKDDILLSVRAPVGDVNVAPFECCIGRGLAAIRANKERLSHLFLFHYLRFKRKRFDALSTGSTFKAIRMKEIENFQVPLPPTPEQKAIVEILGVVDSAIELTDRIIAKIERLKKGLMQELLTKGIGHTEFKETPIGKIPKDWQFGKLVEFSRTKETPIQTGPFGAQLHASDYTDNGVPLILIKNVFDGQIIDDNMPRITKTKASELTRYALKTGDIVFSRVGSVGRAAVVRKYQEGWLISGQMLRVRLENPEIDNEFLRYAIAANWFQRALASRTVGATRKSINTEILENLPMVIPNLLEQQRIANILLDIDKKIELERSEKTILSRVKQSMMDLLLTGKVRIKVT